MSRIAKLIKDARLSVGETQSQFAERLDKGQSVLSKYESGYVSPPVDVIEKCLEMTDWDWLPDAAGSLTDEAASVKGPSLDVERKTKIQEAIQTLLQVVSEE